MTEQEMIQGEQQYKADLKQSAFEQKYPFRMDHPEFTAFGNNKRLVIQFHEPMYILPNSQWYSKTDASGFAISGARVKPGIEKGTGGDLQKRLMRHSVEVDAICFSIGGGIFMKVGNAHKPDGIQKNWWDQDPFSLRFWNESSRKNLGEAIEIQFNLGDRKIWVKNPLEIERFLNRQGADTEVQKVLAQWGAYTKLCPETAIMVHYPGDMYGNTVTGAQAAQYGNQINNLMYHQPTTSATMSPTFLTHQGNYNDVRIFQVLKSVFYPGVMKVQSSVKNSEWGSQALRFVSDISDIKKRALYKCGSVAEIVERFTGRRPKTLIKAFMENTAAIVGDPAGGTRYQGYALSSSGNIEVFIETWVQLATDLIAAEVPMEYVVQMIPFMKGTISETDKEFRNFFIEMVKEIGYVKVLGLLERSASPVATWKAGDPQPEPVQDPHALGTHWRDPIAELVEAARILKENRSKLKDASVRQKKVFPNGVQLRRYYKTAKEVHDDLSAQSTRYSELGQSEKIEWDKRWIPIHGVREGDLRILLPRSTSTLVRWGKKQHHCISTYSRGMLPFRGNKPKFENGQLIEAPRYGYNDGKTERTILAGVFRGNEVLYCMRMEYHSEGAPIKMTGGQDQNPPLPWTLEEFRGFQNQNPDRSTAQQVCAMLNKAGISTERWFRNQFGDSVDAMGNPVIERDDDNQYVAAEGVAGYNIVDGIEGLNAALAGGQPGE